MCCSRPAGIRPPSPQRRDVAASTICQPQDSGKQRNLRIVAFTDNARLLCYTFPEPPREAHMLFQLGNLSADPRALLWFVIALSVAFIVGLTFHEFSHALVAYSLGDRTAQSFGRLTLNPARHLDPLGTLMILFIGFGWAKPTPVNPRNLRSGPRAGMAWVSLAGPLSNFVIAGLAALPLRFHLLELRLSISHGVLAPPTGATVQDYIAFVLFYVVLFNILLGLFNLIPLAPLDGTAIFIALFPGELGDFVARIAAYGPGVLFALLLLGSFIPSLDIFTKLILPLQDRILNLLLT
jgi:Zn-dependent protease